MKHAIDPKIDCVFKSILGTIENRNLLIHFINAILGSALKSLPERMLYTWSDIYSQQIQRGEEYQELKPTYSIWLLDKPLIKDAHYARHYKMLDDYGNKLLEHGGIWVLELSKFIIPKAGNTKECWLAFFKDGDKLDDKALPRWMQSNEMRQAMGTLKQFSEKEREYDRYQARQNYLRQQKSIERERTEAIEDRAEALKETAEALENLAQVEIEKKQALQREESALLREESALAEVARLKALLAKDQ